MRNVSIYIADPDPGVRDQCRRLLQDTDNAWIIGETDNTGHAVESIQNNHPGVLILGLDLVKESHSILIQLVRSRSPGTQVIILANETDQVEILDTLAAGAKGYMSYGDLDIYLPKAVQKVYYDGEAWIPRKMVSAILDRLRSATTASVPQISRSIQ